MKSLLGGKGAGVAEMMRLGVPVPDGFTVTTQACIETMNNGGTWPAGLRDQISDALARFEERAGRKLGASEKPLLVSVRSGAVVSMPGMMDTILNLGISDESVAAVAAEATMSASPGTVTAASSRCTARSSRASTRTSTRTP